MPSITVGSPTVMVGILLSFSVARKRGQGMSLGSRLGIVRFRDWPSKSHQACTKRTAHLSYSRLVAHPRVDGSRRQCSAKLYYAELGSRRLIGYLAWMRLDAFFSNLKPRSGRPRRAAPGDEVSLTVRRGAQKHPFQAWTPQPTIILGNARH
ncbi:hypothetical protein L1887_60370 [Cichorium endivia]|nr:hypothetical protein L1887_60370 [Cichorium endivia]